MTEMLLNWVADTFTRSDIIDLYFIISDLVDLPITEAELCETAYFDALAMNTLSEADRPTNIPIGKMVL